MLCCHRDGERTGFILTRPGVEPPFDSVGETARRPSLVEASKLAHPEGDHHQNHRLHMRFPPQSPSATKQQGGRGKGEMTARACQQRRGITHWVSKPPSATKDLRAR